MKPRAVAVALALALTASQAQAAPLRLDDDTAGVPLVPACTRRHDPGGRMTVREALDTREGFEPTHAAGVHEGFTRDVVWYRCHLRNGGRTRGEWLVDVGGVIDYVDVHVATRGGVRSSWGGRLRPFDRLEVPYPSFVVRVLVDGGDDATVLLRLRSGAPIVMRPRVWAAHAFLGHALRELLIIGGFYAVLLVMLAYNAMLYASTRERVYGRYVLFIVALILFASTFDQTLPALLTPRDPSWMATSGARFGSLLLAAVMAFAREYLETATRAPRYDRATLALTAMCAITFALTFVTNAMLVKQAMFVVGMAVLVPTVAVAFVAWRAGSRGASWFVLATGATAAGFVTRGGVQLGILPTGPFTENGWRFAVTFEVAMLSLGLAARVRDLREGRERAQRELLAAREGEAARLEALVVARTRELEEAQRALGHQKRMTSLGQLAAALAHEVANPLNFTVGGAGELSRRLDALAAATEALTARDPDNLDAAKARLALKGARKALELVQGGNDRIRGVIDSLRAYTRSDARGVEAVDLAEAVKATARLMEQRFRQASVDVTLALDGLPRAKGRVSELSQVFMNLLLNSVQAMPDGGAITVTGRHDDARVALTFADTGPGIPPERRSKVFDPYFTTHEEDGGTGLGLSISHEIVTHHGGTLKLLDAEVGAVFEVSLPRWRDNDASG